MTGCAYPLNVQHRETNETKPKSLAVDYGGRVLLVDFTIGHSFDGAVIVVVPATFHGPEPLDKCAGDDEEE
jgi:hypothetical protein